MVWEVISNRQLLVASILLCTVPTFGCSVDDMDYTGLQCPCPSGWNCDANTNACKRGPTQSAQDASVDSGLQDATPDLVEEALSSDAESGADQPAISVANLRVAWTTPNWIRWEWESEGAADDLMSFELVTGPTEQDVLQRTSAATVWTADQNPELGRFFLSAVGGEDPVVVTLTDQHDPGTEYYGQLTAIDTSGQRSKSNVAGGRTTDPPNTSVIIFSEDDVGWSVPSGVVLSSRNPYAGTYHYDFVMTCDDGEIACFENPGRQGINSDPLDISLGAFSTTAFVEFALATEGPAISYWSQVRMSFVDQTSKLYYYPAWTLRSDGEYHLYQIPLREFTNDEGDLSYDIVALGVYEFNVGGVWSDGVYTSFDEVRIRW